MLLRNFLKNENGNISLLFAGSMMAICSVVGISVDYARLINEKQKTQAALDASLLAAATEYQKTGSKVKALAVGHAHMTSSLPNHDSENLVMEVLNNNQLSGSYHDIMENTFLKVANMPTTNWSVETRLKLPKKSTSDFALAIDVSNTMVKNGLMAGLYDSLDQFSTEVFQNASNGEVSVSLFPFANAVSFDEDIYTKWLDPVHGYDQTDNEFFGCFEYEPIGSKDLMSTVGNRKRIAAADRRKQPNGDNVPFCPEEKSNAAFYITDEETLTDKTSELSTGQGTNTADGLTWAWRSLSTSWRGEFDESATYPRENSATHKKVIILLTDGVPYALPSVKVGEKDKAAVNAAASAEFNEVCRQIIAAGNVDLYSIVYGTQMNADQSQDIHNCIAGDGKTFRGENEDELTAIFSSIVTLNTNLSLSR